MEKEMEKEINGEVICEANNKVSCDANNKVSCDANNKANNKANNTYELETYPLNDADEFSGIIQLLADSDLSVLHQALLLADDNEQYRYLRKMRDKTRGINDLYNAYCARTLVLDPVTYIKNEIIFRFNRLKCVN